MFILKSWDCFKKTWLFSNGSGCWYVCGMAHVETRYMTKYCWHFKSTGNYSTEDFNPVMGIRLFQENGSLSISPEDFILYLFCKIFLSILKIFKTFVFFLRTSSEYLTRYGQGSVFKNRFPSIFLWILTWRS